MSDEARLPNPVPIPGEPPGGVKLSDIRVPELDGLRGLAIAAVLLWHYVGIPMASPSSPAALHPLAKGFILFRSGVDLFFVLSGFLITGILLDHARSPKLFRVFYGRRALRILPLYYSMVALFVLGRLWTNNDPLFVSYPDIPPWSYAVFLQNYFMAHANSHGPDWLGATWSLAIEEQFYLLLPLLVRFLSPRDLVRLFAVGIVTACLLRPILFFTYSLWSFAGYVWLPCRVDSLFLGALIAYTLRSPEARLALMRRRGLIAAAFAILFLGVLALGRAVAGDIGIHMTLWGHTYLTIFYGTALLLALLYAGEPAARFLRSRWLGRLATISYAVYLTHGVVLRLAFRAAGETVIGLSGAREASLILLALGATLLLCSLSYRFLERPCIGYGHRLHYEKAGPRRRRQP